ncbi:unnamed protein product [Chrysoparadoxa australica]
MALKPILVLTLGLLGLAEALVLAPLQMGTQEVTVKAMSRLPVDVQLLGSYGAQTKATSGPQASDLVVMESFSGVSAAGEEVVGVAPLGTIKKGARVDVEDAYIVPRPSDLNWDQAAIFPALYLTCLAALNRAGFGEGGLQGKTCIVTGGYGSMAPYAIQLLSGLGARVWAATTNTKALMAKVGTEGVVDFREDSFSDEVKGIDLILDTLGKETPSSEAFIKASTTAAYVSLQPPILQLAIDEGLFFGGGKILQFQKNLSSGKAAAYWMPGAAAMASLRERSKASRDRNTFGKDLIGMQEYLEALAWPKDADTGLRYGFPGGTNEYWGEGEEEEEDEEEEEWLGSEQDGVLTAKQTFGGGVTDVVTAAELRAAVGDGSAVLFVSSSSCRVCKYLKPYWRKLGPKLSPGAPKLLHLNSSNNPELAQELGLRAVPSFIGYKGGRAVRVSSTSAKAKIQELVDEVSARVR